jgi:hypothetical protein
VATFSDVPSAHVMATLFRAEGVPAEMVSDTSLVGEARSSGVHVPPALAHRARWLMSHAHLTDAELTFLATGELGDSNNAERRTPSTSLTFGAYAAILTKTYVQIKS